MVAGYPLLLSRLPTRRAPAVRKDLSYQPSVTVVVAVHNGAHQIRAKLETLFGLDYPRHLVDIIIVSDGSTDATASIVGEYCSQGVTLIDVPRGGKAAALNAGIPHAKGEVLFFTDVRQPLDPQALRHLAANFADPTVGAVTGELHLMKGDSGEQADMDLYWRYEIWARTRHSEIDSLFNTTGCIYAMRRSLAAPIPADTLTDDAILPLRAFFAGYRVVFDPAAIAWDWPAVSGTEFRRRFRTLAGLWQVFARVPALFSGRNRMRWHFLSHKFSRLAMPWALLFLFLATLAIPNREARIWGLTLELLPVFLALINRFVPTGSRLKRLSSPARTFLVMNLAALAAVAVFVLPASKIWKPTKTA
jgi:cellulose synthase/poly-beta-1,6-N-acetylglucosamine synthase-like glycosyltransferase